MAGRSAWTLQCAHYQRILDRGIYSLPLVAFQLSSFSCRYHRFCFSLWVRQWRICLSAHDLHCQGGKHRDNRTTLWDLSNNRWLGVSRNLNFQGIDYWQLTYDRCLTGLPIMGAILNRQKNVDFSGLQIFAAVCILLGATLTAGATYFFARLSKTWKV